MPMVARAKTTMPARCAARVESLAVSGPPSAYGAMNEAKTAAATSVLVVPKLCAQMVGLNAWKKPPSAQVAQNTEIAAGSRDRTVSGMATCGRSEASAPGLSPTGSGLERRSKAQMASRTATAT